MVAIAVFVGGGVKHGLKAIAYRPINVQKLSPGRLGHFVEALIAALTKIKVRIAAKIRAQVMERPL